MLFISSILRFSCMLATRYNRVIYHINYFWFKYQFETSSYQQFCTWKYICTLSIQLFYTWLVLMALKNGYAFYICGKKAIEDPCNFPLKKNICLFMSVALSFWVYFYLNITDNSAAKLGSNNHSYKLQTKLLFSQLLSCMTCMCLLEELIHFVEYYSEVAKQEL